MQSLTDNIVIEQIRKTLRSAMTLKEIFDTNQKSEVLEGYRLSFENEMNVLSDLLPNKILQKGNILRHSYFLNLHISGYSDDVDPLPLILTPQIRS